MNHELEFQQDNTKDRDQHARELAAIYARLFATADGQRVLADLHRKLNPQQPRFTLDQPNPLSAARIEGRCDVWREISNATRLGGGASLLANL